MGSEERMSGTWSARDAARWKPDSTTQTEASGRTPPVVYWTGPNDDQGTDHFSTMDGVTPVFAAFEKMGEGAVEGSDFKAKSKVFFFSLPEPQANTIGTMWRISGERIKQLHGSGVDTTSADFFQWIYVQRAIRHDVWAFGKKHLFKKAPEDSCHNPRTPFLGDGSSSSFASQPLRDLVLRFENQRDEWKTMPYRVPAQDAHVGQNNDHEKERGPVDGE